MSSPLSLLSLSLPSARMLLTRRAEVVIVSTLLLSPRFLLTPVEVPGSLLSSAAMSLVRTLRSSERHGDELRIGGFPAYLRVARPSCSLTS